MRLTMSRRQREGDSSNTVTLEFSELVGGSTEAFAGVMNGERTVSGYTVSGSTVTLTLGTDVQPGDETQVSTSEQYCDVEGC